MPLTRAGGARSCWFYDQSYEHSYDWSDGGRRPGVWSTAMVGRQEAGDTRRGVPAGGAGLRRHRRREVSSSLIYTWRKQLREGKLAGVVASLPLFAEVQVVDLVAPTPQPAPCLPGLIHIDLPGGVRVKVDAAVDAGALARVLSVLR